MLSESENVVAGGLKSDLLTWWPLRLLGGLFAIAGLSSLLYGIGFLVLRSHYTFWGIWNGLPQESGLLVEEGGRFLFHSLFWLFDLVNPLAEGNSAVYSIVLLLCVTLIWAPDRWLSRGLSKITFKRENGPRNALIGVQLVAGLAGILIGTFVLEAMAILLSANDLLHPGACIPGFLKPILLAPNTAYQKIGHRLLLFVALLVVTIRTGRLHAAFYLKIGNVIMGILLLLSIGMLPAVYGRLVHPRNYPLVTVSGVDTGNTYLLIQATKSSWIIWNRDKMRTEVISRSGQQQVRIGVKQSLVRDETMAAKKGACEE
ncbi:hypothetical protein [Desulfosarcina ovata]|uniref:Uncharacterized protein n=1 Tax=Desulfosarcina ovata subsp. ovata TaxID=2752305 RepID=A0A5K8AK97_9BACT|nr:hypothetical protein [Desulfosarcina ovata]BBO93111.1 hypothetical protein DSCOOX_62910 [Desulfosarcina ovata subsp. ovata]